MAKKQSLKNRRPGETLLYVVLTFSFAINIYFTLLHCFTNLSTQSQLGVTSAESNYPDKSSITDNKTFYPVDRVIDGDTIRVFVGEKSESVRLIGVDAPESTSKTDKECYGPESTQFLKKIISNGRVRLEYDETQGERDKYGRLLRYVWLGDVMVNEQIIISGHGKEYTYNAPYKYRDLFIDAEVIARNTTNNIWDICDNE